MRGRIGEAARRPFGIIEKLEPNTSPTGTTVKTSASGHANLSEKKRLNRPSTMIGIANTSDR